MWCVFIILGIVAEVLKANAILVIPSVVEYILFGVGGLLLLIQIITWNSARHQVSNMQKRFKNRF